MIRIIFSDIDGTLINDDLVVTENTKQSLIKAREQGSLIVPVSARMPKAIRPILNSFMMDFPIISYNGALIIDEKGQELESHSMKKGSAIEICRFIMATKEVVWNVYSGDSWYSQSRNNPWIQREERIVGLSSEEASLFEIENLSEIHKLLLMGDSVKILEIETKLKNDYPYLSISKSSPHYLEVMANGIHKGEAVSFLAAYYGVNIKDTIAFGDNFNDLDMLLTVGQGFVMANGPEIVQQRVGQTTTDNNHDGIAHVLNRYFNGDEPFKVD
ncbi:Cof-type HAD-IIB family hydrolase [Streptococcus parasuis]|jgi:Cof subfamily protein (haloacid dehalogenase superfamily)|uniref:Cof-type HAD-IIB family hydrolase n=1 Tax=Streptococcus parasuis TaxID=1501662 RepID=UPI0028A20448|nr:Cof-type HAD-IIB family hydrolase [Streptococcus parasuis]